MTHFIWRNNDLNIKKTNRLHTIILYGYFLWCLWQPILSSWIKTGWGRGLSRAWRDKLPWHVVSFDTLVNQQLHDNNIKLSCHSNTAVVACYIAHIKCCDHFVAISSHFRATVLGPLTGRGSQGTAQVKPISKTSQGMWLPNIKQ